MATTPEADTTQHGSDDDEGKRAITFEVSALVLHSGCDAIYDCLEFIYICKVVNRGLSVPYCHVFSRTSLCTDVAACTPLCILY